ncbi:nuclear protein localization protein 4 [Coemansia sp. RSA 2703]|nr:nuclear protein localization protein 4 [Coemansia sp. RSA 2703]KAJ2377552.1 nuclear protein localization protein 4 [Coemansia sp. RSA 2607]KAJ2397928.1 nuclear protein localization protein 4 [Coemansia sp. RSA 2603]
MSVIIRVRAPDGMHRVNVGLTDTLAQLLDRLAPMMKAPTPDAILLTRDVGGKQLMAEFEKSIVSLGLKNGDMLFASIAASARPSVEPSSNIGNSDSKGSERSTMPSFVMQEKVDNQLEKDDGLVKRKRDAGLCKHGANAMCEYCLPIEPYDAGYLAQNEIKHMSFHAYLRKILAESKIHGDISGGLPANVVPPLEDPDYRVKPHCKGGHASWPEGICSKCQPSAITLQRQTFRMVDNVEFASPELIERLLSFWQTTGCQRFGFLYGHYERSLNVPLGIKAVVETIYEPKQGWEKDGVTLALESPEFDAEMSHVNAVAESCGLKPVGMIFTDLEASDVPKKVLYRRHGNSYFLTSLECRLAAYMELRYPNTCRWAKNGHFGSKFVTCCLSGNQDGDIDVSAWQVSNSAMAMYRADLIVPSSVPSKMCVQESTKTRYVPDVFYTYKNEYNLPVTANAKPAFPVEYLLVNLTHGFPSEPNPVFKSTRPFCIENREHLQQAQTLGLVKRHIKDVGGSAEEMANLLSDFHFLVYLASLDILSPDEIKLMGQTATADTPESAAQLAGNFMASNGWQTLALMLQEASDSDLNHGAGSAMDTNNSSGATATSSSSTTAASNAEPWACRHCTFVNMPSNSSCEMCALPKD